MDAVIFNVNDLRVDEIEFALKGNIVITNISS